MHDIGYRGSKHILMIVVFLPFKWLRHTHRSPKESRLQQTRNVCSRLKFFTKKSYISWNKFFISDRLQYVYCSVPKAACTSWILTLLKLTGKDLSRITSVYDVHDKRVTDKILEREVHYEGNGQGSNEIMRLKNYFKFTMVREPLDRLISAYRDKCFHDPHYKWLSREIKKRRQSRSIVHEGGTAKLYVNVRWCRTQDLAVPCVCM